MKTCKVCNEEKDFEQFKKHAKSADGYTSICASCTGKPGDAQEQIDDLKGRLDKVVASTNAAFLSMNEKVDSQFNGFSDQLSAILRAVKDPVSIRKTVESGEQECGGDGDAMFNDDPEHTSLIKPEHRMPDTPEFRKKAEALAFNEEPVTIIVQRPNEKFSDANHDYPYISVGVNGINQRFEFDKEITVKRKFVEQLARAKPVHYGLKKVTDSEGAETYIYPRTSRLRFNYSIIKDTPKGMAYLRAVQAQP